MYIIISIDKTTKKKKKKKKNKSENCTLGFTLKSHYLLYNNQKPSTIVKKVPTQIMSHIVSYLLALKRKFQNKMKNENATQKDHLKVKPAI